MAEKELKKLLKGMQPRLSDGRYFFCSVSEQQMSGLYRHLQQIIGIFREKEGLTVIFSGDALEGMRLLSPAEPAGPFALITLQVQSDLLAVGFLAAVTSALAKEKIPANAFSAYYHDHLLVPYEKKEEAMRCLGKLQKSA